MSGRGERTAKRKSNAIESSEEEDEPSLRQRLKKFRRELPIIYPGPKEYLLDLTNTTDTADEVLHGTYHANASLLNRFYLPPCFNDFKIIRDNTGRVICVQDSSGHKLVGSALTKVMIRAGLQIRGVTKIIIGHCDNNNIGLLAIPGDIQYAITAVETIADRQTILRFLFSSTVTTRLYATPKAFLEVLSMKYITTEDFKSVATLLNQVFKREPKFELDPKSLESLATLEVELDNILNKSAKKSFYNALFAANISKATMESKLSAFSKHPSFRLAHSLGFRMPHQGPVHTKMGAIAIAAVNLSTLGDDEEVLLSTHVLSAGNYASCVGVADTPVFVNTSALGSQQNKKWREMKVKFVLKASIVRQYLETIEKANQDVKVVTDNSDVKMEPEPTDEDVAEDAW